MQAMCLRKAVSEALASASSFSLAVPEAPLPELFDDLKN